jgi:hypothetical protein
VFQSTQLDVVKERMPYLQHEHDPATSLVGTEVQRDSLLLKSRTNCLIKPFVSRFPGEGGTVCGNGLPCFRRTKVSADSPMVFPKPHNTVASQFVTLTALDEAAQIIPPTFPEKCQRNFSLFLRF